MKIGSKYKFSEVQVRHWDQFAESAGLAQAQTGRGFSGQPLIEQIAKGVRVIKFFNGEFILTDIA